MRTADRLSDVTEFLRRPLTAEELIAAAQHRTALDDFGEWEFLDALRALLRACDKEAELGAFGRFALRWDGLRFLTNLLFLRAAEKTATFRAQPVQQPIFVTGLPRSGTSFLHNILVEDPLNVAPRCWQAIHPDAAGNERREGRAIRSVDRSLAIFRLLAPDLGAMHPITATTPQECTEITAHLFASLRFETTYHIPSYRAWLGNAGHLEAYRFHRRFLEHLGRHDAAPRRWVLKCPDHVFALDAIQKVYPDARFVFVHRDPMHVLASVARLTEVLRQPFTRRIDRAAIGHQVCGCWADGAARILAAGKTLPRDRVVHIRYDDLVGDPVGAVAQLYAKFGLRFDEAFEANIAAYVAAKPNGGYGRNAHRLEDYSIDAARERGRYVEYMAAFEVAPEPAVRRD